MLQMPRFARASRRISCLLSNALRALRKKLRAGLLAEIRIATYGVYLRANRSNFTEQRGELSTSEIIPDAASEQQRGH